MKRFLEKRHLPLLKVCGITRLEDALASVDAGANALGFNFYPPSPRFIGSGEAEEIISKLPAGVLTFAVIVHGSFGPGLTDRENQVNEGNGMNEPVKYGIPDLVDVIQIHGIDNASRLPLFDRPVLAAVSPETAPGFDEYDIIIDTSWGRGELADWGRVKGLKRPYILSGGLNPGNIEEALDRLAPAGIDACSGVESEPGLKDHEKLRDFLGKALAFYRRRGI